MAHKSSKQPPVRTPGATAPAGPSEKKHEDETLYIPKGIPRWQYLTLIGLMIFLLVIFLIPGPVQNIFRSSGGTNRVVVRWKDAEWHASDVTQVRRTFKDAIQVDPFAAIQVGIDPRNPEDTQVLRAMVLNRMALEAGVDVTDADLAEHLRGMLELQRWTADDFKEIVRRVPADQRTVEESIRQLLRASRYLQLIAFAGGVPDPKKIEEQWKQENVEFAFDYVVLPVEGLKEQARGQLPDDAGLQAWFDKLSDAEKGAFKTAEKRKAELALYRGAESTPAAELLAAFPEKVAEGAQPTPPEEQAQQYYNRVVYRRFTKPQPDKEGEDALQDEGNPEFLKFEEVKDQCLKEAPVYFALQGWLDDLKARKTNGETIDFAAEIQKYGLEHRALDEALTREEVEKLEGLGDPELADAVFTAAADGSFHYSLVVTPAGIVVVRVNERTEPVMPPFESIRDQVAEKWLQPKAEELALAKLKELRAGFEAVPPPAEDAEKKNTPGPAPLKDRRRAAAEAFRTAATGAGLEVETRDWLNKSASPDKDPLAQDEDHKTLLQQAYRFRLYELEADEVAEPGMSIDKKRAYLVRVSGRRDVPLENMSPTDYERFKKIARTQAIDHIERGIDLPFLEKNAGLWLDPELEKEVAKAAANLPQDDG